MRPNPEERYHTHTEYYTSWNGGVTAYPFSLRDYYREWTGSTTPGFPKVKRYNAHHVFESTILRSNYNLYRYQPNVNPANWDSIDYVFRGFPLPTGCPYLMGDVRHAPSVRQRAINRSIDRVQDQKFNLAVAFAERNKTLSLIKGSIERLTRAAYAVKKGDLRELRRALDFPEGRGLRRMSGVPAKDWLAAQYGWKPLLSDIKGAAEHYAQAAFGRPTRLRARSGRVSEVIASYTATAPGVVALGDLMTWHFESGRTDGSCILDYFVYNDVIRNNSQLGITDPLTFAWELVPYSFVVDWFLPVGDFLRRTNYDSGLVFQGGLVTQFSLQVGTVSPVVREWRDAGSGRINKQGPFGGTFFKSHRLDRELLLSLPRPVFPSFEDSPFTELRVANALALLTGVLASFKTAR